MKFSQRVGITPQAKNIQLSSIDDELKNGLWNIFSTSILERIETEHNYTYNLVPSNHFSKVIWHNYFKKPIDEIPYRFEKVKSFIREYFFDCEWYQVYDIIEFVADVANERYFNTVINQDRLFQSFNLVLEREFAGYRFIDRRLAPITNTTEIKEIEDAVDSTESFSLLKGCNAHLKSALTKLSDRQNPDYRNSIKESISAVESLAKIISNNAKDSLGASLDKIKGKLKIHPALERGFKQIYGYTSDTDGIRHALTDEETLDFEDAKFMLVSCSAFVNYLIIKAGKVGVSF